jgi:acyl-CoA reductase-like NAD-dependent aldehyde dehydrogenase
MTVTSAESTSPLVGGCKHSGFGRTMGADAVLDYTQVKTVSMRGTESAPARG